MTVTVGCGSWGNNSICENLQYYHLMNKTKVTVTLPNKRMPKDTDWNDLISAPFWRTDLTSQLLRIGLE